MRVFILAASLAFLFSAPRRQQEPPPAKVYKIVLYDGGSEIGSWNGKDVSEGGPWMFFTDADSGVKITIQGTIIVTGPEEIAERTNNE